VGRKKLSPEIERLVVEGYRKGLPLAEIAERADICKSTVISIARRFGLRRYRKLEELKIGIAEAYIIGLKVEEILDMFRINGSILYRILREFSIPLRRGRM